MSNKYMSDNDYIDHLRNQLRFIENSCLLYDQGHTEEAIRIAQSIRVLVHDTNDSTSLLKLLNARNINLLTSCTPGYETGLLMSAGHLASIKVKINTDIPDNISVEAWYEPNGKEVLNKAKSMQVDNWWNQIIYIFPTLGAFTRRNLVLHAANKDGDAHVAKKLPQAYASLRKGIASTGINYDEEAGLTKVFIDFDYELAPLEGVSVKNTNLADIRQIGEEILASEELFELLK